LVSSLFWRIEISTEEVIDDLEEVEETRVEVIIPPSEAPMFLHVYWRTRRSVFPRSSV
jgi:hypothetical protein